jgi:hypothetical protein
MCESSFPIFFAQHGGEPAKRTNSFERMLQRPRSRNAFDENSIDSFVLSLLLSLLLLLLLLLLLSLLLLLLLRLLLLSLPLPDSQNPRFLQHSSFFRAFFPVPPFLDLKISDISGQEILAKNCHAKTSE